MDKFVKEVNLDPDEIKNMTAEQKQDCMAEIDKRRKQAWIYSIIFSLGVMAYIILYVSASLIKTLSYHSMMESLSGILFIVPIFTFVPSFFAHMMNGKWILAAYIIYVLAGFSLITTSEMINAWASPFAFAGAFLYFRLSRVCDTYNVLSKEEGFPEFCTLEANAEYARAIIEKNNEPEEEPLNILTQIAILAEKSKKCEESETESDIKAEDSKK